MDNSDPCFRLLTAGRGLLQFEMIRDRVRQRAALDAGTGMYDHSCRFVDDGEIFILENDVERDVLRLKSRDWNFDQVDLDLVVFVNFIRWFDRSFVDENVLVLDQPLESRT